MPRTSRLRILTLAIIAYMLLAFAWWSVLLYVKNRDAFHAKAELAAIGMVAEGRVESRVDYESTVEYEELHASYRRQELMILGEAIVFVITLVAGIYLVNRSYRHEVLAARQQRNFLLSITHELKSPLASIRLVLETLMRRQLKPEMQRSLSDSALKETTRLTALVEDLLLSAKLDTQYSPNLEPLDLRRLGEEWINRLRVKYPELTFALKLDGEEFNVLADAYGIGSVFSNLLENAVKYIGNGTFVELYICEQSREVTIEVRDDGLGIAPEEKRHIFEKFYRVGNEDTRSTKGTGLGLYIVDQVVRAHEGTISVKDNLPRGTIFQICLPFGAST